MGNKMFCFQCEQTAGCTGCREMQAFAAKPLMWHSCRMS